MTRDQILERYRHLRAISTPDPADRLHLAGEQTKKEAARGGLSFGNGVRKGGAVRTAIPLSDTVGAVLIRPAKNLIGAESVQERPIDARGAGRLSRLPGLAERPSNGCGCAPDRTLTQGDPTTRGGRGRSLVPRELGTRYLGRRGICAVSAVGGAHDRA